MTNPAVDNSELYPLKFHPVYMERIWGGTLMTEHLNRQLPEHRDPIGEAWELVDREDAVSVVANGTLENWTLHELFTHYGAALAGNNAARYERFPLLVKLIDAGERLSLQVHPDENACRELGNGAEPKTEMWYIIAARKGGKILAGLNPRATRLQMMEKLDSPEVENLLQVYNSEPGDAYFIQSGTLHAIGAGNLILEIQQNSDTTYRISDWGRVGSDGKPRQLHREAGVKSICFTNRTSPRIPGVAGKAAFSRKFDIVTMCPYFKVTDLRLTSEWIDDTSASGSFHLISAVHGKINVGIGEKVTTLLPGESALVPACFGAYRITPLDGGETVALKTTL